MIVKKNTQEEKRIELYSELSDVLNNIANIEGIIYLMKMV